MKVLSCVALAFAAATAAAPTSVLANAPAGDPAKAPVSMCIGCHAIPGYQASFPRVYRVPKIAGQSAQYIEAALQAYRKGDRSHPTMQGVAQGLSDDDIRHLAAYYAARGSAK